MNDLCTCGGPNGCMIHDKQPMSQQERTQAQRELEAMEVLLASDWWTEECENGNYHGFYGPFSFLAELRDQKRKEVMKEAAQLPASDKAKARVMEKRGSKGDHD